MAEKIGLEAVLDMANWNKGVSRYMGDVGRMEGKTGGLVGKLGSLGGQVVGIGVKAAAGVAAAGAGLAIGLGAIATKGIQAAISIESAFAGVTKTTEGLRDEYGKLNQDGETLRRGFLDLALQIPITPEQLMSIGELGGQLGVAKEDLLGFTETIAAMGVSTNLTTEAAASDMARFVQVMGTTEDLGSEAWGRLGSSIVALGNNFATTEADVLTFGQRIAGAGAIVGMTESDVLAIGAAMSSVGIQAEAGGTAVQKVLLSINEAAIKGGKELETYAEVAGLSAEDFKKVWEEDAGEAFNLFVEGLGNQGDNAVMVLEELGIADQRLIRGFLSLSEAGTLLRDTMQVSNDAFEENKALTDEAAQRYATTEAQIQIMKNTFRDLSATLGDALLPVFNDLLSRFTAFVQEHAPEIREAFRKIGEWLSTKLPEAIEKVSEFWTSTLYPALIEVGQWIVGTLIPALTDLWNWLSTNIPLAIQTVSDLWTNTLYPAIVKFGEFVMGTVIPALVELYNWFATNLPGGIQTVSDYWTNTLQPALQTFWDFVQVSIIPMLQTIYDWLVVNLPPAIQTLADFWTTTLQPALEELWGFITESFIPALQEIWAFIDANIIPIMGGLLDVLLAIGEKGFEVLAALWTEVLQPALQDLWDFISVNIIPIIEEFVGWLDQASGGAEGITGAIQDVVTWLGNLADTIRDLELPDWLKPGSPTPWEKALVTLASTVKGDLKSSFVDFGTTTTKNLGSIYGDTEAWKNLLVLITDETLPNLQTMFQTVSEYILQQLRLMIETTETWRRALEYITNTTLPALQAAFLALAAAVIAALNRMIAKTNEWRKALEDVIDTINDLKSEWMDAFDDMISKTQELIDKLNGEGGLVSAIEDTKSAMETFVSDSITGLTSLINKIQEAIEWFKRAIDRKQQLESGGPDEMNYLADSIWNVANAAGALTDNLRRATLAMPTFTMPTMAMPAMAGATTNNQTLNMTFGPTTINNGMDQARFEGRIRQTVRDAMRGN